MPPKIRQAPWCCTEIATAQADSRRLDADMHGAQDRNADLEPEAEIAANLAAASAAATTDKLPGAALRREAPSLNWFVGIGSPSSRACDATANSPCCDRQNNARFGFDSAPQSCEKRDA